MVLLPIRFTVLVFTCFIFSIIARVAVIGVSAEKLYKIPLSPTRRKLITIAHICSKISFVFNLI